MPKNVNGRRQKTLHRDEHHHVYCSPNIITVIKASRVRRAVHVTQGMAEKFMQNFSRTTSRVKTN